MHAATLKAKIARMQERRQTHATMLADLVASGERQVSLTDPDARGMATHPKVGVGYNAQVALDAKHKLIVEQHVTNAGSDLGLLAQTAGAARELLGVERIDAVADKVYYKVRTSPPARRLVSVPTLPGHNATRPSPRGASPKTSSPMMRQVISTVALRAIASLQSSASRKTVVARSSTATGRPVVAVR